MEAMGRDSLVNEERGTVINKEGRVGDQGAGDSREVVNYLTVGAGCIGKQIKLN